MHPGRVQRLARIDRAMGRRLRQLRQEKARSSASSGPSGAATPGALPPVAPLKHATGRCQRGLRNVAIVPLLQRLWLTACGALVNAMALDIVASDSLGSLEVTAEQLHDHANRIAMW